MGSSQNCGPNFGNYPCVILNPSSQASDQKEGGNGASRNTHDKSESETRHVVISLVLRATIEPKTLLPRCLPHMKLTPWQSFFKDAGFPNQGLGSWNVSKLWVSL